MSLLSQLLTQPFPYSRHNDGPQELGDEPHSPGAQHPQCGEKRPNWQLEPCRRESTRGEALSTWTCWLAWEGEGRGEDTPGRRGLSKGTGLCGDCER